MTVMERGKGSRRRGGAGAEELKSVGLRKDAKRRMAGESKRQSSELKSKRGCDASTSEGERLSYTSIDAGPLEVLVALLQ
jgi:hypothetical protein